MAPLIQIWYDHEADFLEIMFSNAAGYMREIAADVYERVDTTGNLLGYAIMNFSRHDRKDLSFPFEVMRLSKPKDELAMAA